jgi:LPXTG-motif cell wall-anchored protein
VNGLVNLPDRYGGYIDALAAAAAYMKLRPGTRADAVRCESGLYGLGAAPIRTNLAARIPHGANIQQALNNATTVQTSSGDQDAHGSEPATDTGMSSGAKWAIAGAVLATLGAGALVIGRRRRGL